MTLPITLDINLQLNRGLERFMKGSNWYPCKDIDILDWKVLDISMIKGEVKMEHPSGRITMAKGDVTFDLTAPSGYLLFLMLFLIMSMR